MDIYVIKVREIEGMRGGVLMTYHQKIRKSVKALLNERSMSCKSSDLRHRGQNRRDRRGAEPYATNGIVKGQKV